MKQSAVIIREALRRKKDEVRADIAAGRIEIKNEARIECTDQLLDFVALHYATIRLFNNARWN